MRRTGRTQQLNLKVRPEFKAEIHELARKHNTTIVGVIEMAVELLAKYEG